MTRNRYAAFALLMATVVYPPGFAEAQLEGVVLIDQDAALSGNVTPGDAPGFPVEIRRRGSYRLVGNLSIADPEVTAIVITDSHVTLDLNGFVIEGPAAQCRHRFVPVWCTQGATGIGIRASGKYATVLRGTVRDMASHGVLLGDAARIDRLLVGRNRGDGVVISVASSISDSFIYENTGAGIRCSSCLVFRNSVVRNVGFGLAGFDILFGDNVFHHNNISSPIPVYDQVDIPGGALEAGGNVCVSRPACM